MDREYVLAVDKNEFQVTNMRIYLTSLAIK